MRGEKRWPGDRPDIRDPPEWGGDGVWVCWKRPGEMNLEGKKYPKVRGKAERKFGCGECDRKLGITNCSGPRHFDGWTVEAIVERFGDKAILEREPDVPTKSEEGESVPKVEGESEVMVSGKVDGD